jgi:hypothetical protein
VKALDEAGLDQVKVSLGRRRLDRFAVGPVRHLPLHGRPWTVMARPNRMVSAMVVLMVMIMVVGMTMTMLVMIVHGETPSQ